MGIRETLSEKPAIGWGIGVLLVLVASVVLARAYWPEKKADLSQAWYTTDDGQTWFADSAYRVPPFEHDGKTAVIAQVFSYHDGSKKFCAYLTQFTPEASKQLQTALAEAKQKGQPPDSVGLYHDRNWMNQAMLLKKPGAGRAWVRYDDPKAIDVMSVRSPDGSAVDQVFVY